MSRRGKEAPTSDQRLQEPCLWPVSLLPTDDFDQLRLRRRRSFQFAVMSYWEVQSNKSTVIN